MADHCPDGWQEGRNEKKACFGLVIEEPLVGHCREFTIMLWVSGGRYSLLELKVRFNQIPLRLASNS